MSFDRHNVCMLLMRNFNHVLQMIFDADSKARLPMSSGYSNNLQLSSKQPLDGSQHNRLLPSMFDWQINTKAILLSMRAQYMTYHIPSFINALQQMHNSRQTQLWILQNVNYPGPDVSYSVLANVWL